jgi:DNA repair exonuclease SbcCD ATPase subunit
VYLDSVEIKKQEVKMDKEKELQKLIDELRAENMKLQASLQENNAKELAKQVESLTKNLSDKDEELKKVNASVIAKDESIKSLNAKTDEISKNHKEVSEKLAAIENEQKISKRILLVASKLKLAEADAKQFVENLNSLPDEIFTKHVEFEAGKLVASKIEEKVTEGRKADEKVLEKIEKPAQEINLVTASKKPEDGVKQINQAVSKILEKTMNKLFAEAKEVK